MALRLVFDNQAEQLLAHALQLIGPPPGGAPVPDAFASDALIVPGLGVGRWIQQQAAGEFGVSARLDPDLPGRFLWRLVGRLLPGVPEQSPFDPVVARWTVLRLLDSLAAGQSAPRPGFALLRARVEAASPTQRLRLATDIAGLFDRYLAFRRDWLDAWLAGKAADGRGRPGDHFGDDERWQAWLWVELARNLPGVSGRHPFDRFNDLIASALTAGATERAALAAATGVRQVIVFGMPSMGPEQFHLFARIAQLLPVTFLVPDPCREFWHDIVSRKRLADVRRSSPDVAWLFDSEPWVLGNWGQAHRDYLAQLRQLDELPAGDGDHGAAQVIEVFRERDLPPASHRLQALQQSILLLDDSRWRGLPDAAGTGQQSLFEGVDRSLQIHGCHGRIRQVEVLHDLLLAGFADHPDLQPADCVVYCSKLDDMAPAIDAVFAGGSIPYGIAGRTPLVDPVVAALRGLLNVARGNVTRSAVEELLENPAIAAALELDGSQHRLLLEWFAQAGVYWGLAGGPRKHDWQAAFDRLWLGASIAPDAFEGGAAVLGETQAVTGAAGSLSLLLGKVERLFATLRRLSHPGAQRQPVARWCELVLIELDRLFEGLAARAGPWTGGLMRVRDSVAQVGDSARDSIREPGRESAGGSTTDPSIDLAAFCLALDESLEQAAPTALATGAVTFAPIGALRGVPYRVIGLLGMDQEAFPRLNRASEFDLMFRQPRFGDRISRTEDRGVFLDILLAARDQLLVLFAARDARDNSELNPSTVIDELIAYVREQPGQQAFGIIEHPLQPFSARNFAAGRPESFARQWFDAARVLDTPAGQRPQPAGPGNGAASVTPPLPVPFIHFAPPARSADPLTVGAAHPSGSSESPAVWSHRDLVIALAKPAQTYLQHALGISLPRRIEATEDREPLDAEADDRRALIQQVLDVASEPAVLQRRIDAWLTSPALPDGAPGARVHAGLRAEASGIIARRPKAWSDIASPLAFSRQQVRWNQALLETAHLAAIAGRPRSADMHLQCLLSAYKPGAYGLIDAWLRHLAAQLWLGSAQPRAGVPAELITTLIAADSIYHVRSMGPAERGIESALHWAALVRSRPLMLFPKTYWAFFKSAGDVPMSAVARATGPWVKAREAFEGNAFGGGDRPSGELNDPWVAVLYRDGPPDLEAVIAASEPVYRPIFGCVEGDSSAGPS